MLTEFAVLRIPKSASRSVQLWSRENLYINRSFQHVSYRFEIIYKSFILMFSEWTWHPNSQYWLSFGSAFPICSETIIYTSAYSGWLLSVQYAMLDDREGLALEITGREGWSIIREVWGRVSWSFNSLLAIWVPCTSFSKVQSRNLLQNCGHAEWQGDMNLALFSTLLH